MKRLLYIPLFLVCLLSCKEDNDSSPMQSMTFQTMSGAWRSAEVEKSSLGNGSTWEPIAAAQSDTLVFRSDGVILNANGKPRCCAPNTLTVNGRLYDVKPTSALPANADCELVNCVTCPTWEISWEGNQMIIGTCNSPKTKYVR